MLHGRGCRGKTEAIPVFLFFSNHVILVAFTVLKVDFMRDKEECKRYEFSDD